MHTLKDSSHRTVTPSPSLTFMRGSGYLSITQITARETSNLCTVGKTTEKAAQDLKDSVNKIETWQIRLDSYKIPPRDMFRWKTGNDDLSRSRGNDISNILIRKMSMKSGGQHGTRVTLLLSPVHWEEFCVKNVIDIMK